MTDSKAIYCLSSDEDEDEDDLLNGSFLHRRRNRYHSPPANPAAAAEVTESSNDGSNDGSIEKIHKKPLEISLLQNEDEEGAGLLQEALTASRETFEVEERRRQSSLEDSTPETDKNYNSLSEDERGGAEDDDDDESALEVLPATKPAPPSLHTNGPRLSCSGQGAADPVDLVDLPQSPIHGNHCLDDSPTIIKQETSVASSPLWSPLPEPRHFRENLHPPENMILNSNSSTSPNDAKEAAAKRPAGNIDALLEDDNDSDSEDSFSAHCKAFEARRQINKKLRLSPNDKSKSSNSTSAAGAADDTKTKSKGKNPTRKLVNQEQKERNKEAAKERSKQLAKEQKEREKQAAKDQREREKLAKQAAKEAEKKQRQENRTRSHQVRGRYANQEVAVLAEPTLLDTATNQWKIVEALAASGFNHIKAYPSGLSCHALQFIRQEYLKGGAGKAVETLLQDGPSETETSYEHIPLLAVVVEAPQLIDLIQQDDENDESHQSGVDDDDYPKLEQWLFGLVAAWRAAWHQSAAKRPRIILLLHKVPAMLDRVWVQYNRSGRRGPCPPNSEQLYDAILWMLIQFQIESVHCPTDEDVAHEIFKMTRLLAETPYARQATDLQTMAKLPAHVSDMAPSADRARDTWIRQLQQIPRLSADMAQSVAHHYPTAMSLWKVYQDDELNLSEKQLLLADLFGTRSSQVKLSMHVYRALTSDNPHEILS